jgi:hypothetical protein
MKPRRNEEAQAHIGLSNHTKKKKKNKKTYLLSKELNCLDAVKRGDLSLSLTTLQPDIQNLASVYQAH